MAKKKEKKKNSQYDELRKYRHIDDVPEELFVWPDEYRKYSEDMRSVWANEKGASGNIPKELFADFIDPVTGRKQYTLPAAAEAWLRLQRAAEEEIGERIGITNIYNTHEVQTDKHERKPEITLPPGESIHGWGRAFDINVGGGPIEEHPHAYQWMLNNAHKYGFGRPFLNAGIKYEPYHWEFAGYGDVVNPVVATQYNQSREGYDQYANTLYGLMREKQRKAERLAFMDRLREMSQSVPARSPISRFNNPSPADGRVVQFPYTNVALQLPPQLPPDIPAPMPPTPTLYPVAAGPPQHPDAYRSMSAAPWPVVNPEFVRKKQPIDYDPYLAEIREKRKAAEEEGWFTKEAIAGLPYKNAPSPPMAPPDRQPPLPVWDEFWWNLAIENEARGPWKGEDPAVWRSRTKIYKQRARGKNVE